jgi:hypothetical protein
MRGIVLGLMTLAVAGCAGSLQWEKAGADRETAKQELRECRRAATTEAWRISPANVPTRHRWPVSSGYHSSRPDPYFVRNDNDRLTNERRLTSFCMRNKGYELSPVPTELSPTSPPRST